MRRNDGSDGVAQESDGNGRGPRTQRGDFIPPGYETRTHAVTDVIRFGPVSLHHAEFLALLYHVERSVTYGKSSDATSIAQMTSGVFDRRAGKWIRGGCGLGRSAAIAANRQLASRGLLKIYARRGSKRRCLANAYMIDWEKVKAHFDAFRGVLPKGGDEATYVDENEGEGSAERTVPSPKAEPGSLHKIDREGATARADPGPKAEPGSVHKTDWAGATERRDPGTPTGPASLHESDRNREDIYRSSSQSKSRQTSCEDAMPQEATVDGNSLPDASLIRDDELSLPKSEAEAKKRTRDIIEQNTTNNSDNILRVISRQFEIAGWPQYWIEYWRQIAKVTTAPEIARGGHYVAQAKRLISEYRAQALERALKLTNSPEPVNGSEDLCPHCKCRKGSGALIVGGRFEPCPECSTTEWAAELKMKEDARLQRKAELDARRMINVVQLDEPEEA